MPEEIIGGIGVTVGGSLSELESVLAKAESMVAASAKRVAPVADRYFVPGGAAAGGNASSRAAASQGGSSSSRQTDLTAFTRAIGEATTRLTALVAALTSANFSVRRTSSSGGGGAQGSVGADTAAALSAIASSPSRAVRARVAVERMMPKGGASDLTTHSFDPRDQAVNRSAEDADRQRQTAALFEQYAQRPPRRAAPASDAEQRLLAALYPDRSARRARAQTAQDRLGPNPAGEGGGPQSREVFGPRTTPETDMEHMGLRPGEKPPTAEERERGRRQRQEEARRQAFEDEAFQDAMRQASESKRRSGGGRRTPPPTGPVQEHDADAILSGRELGRLLNAQQSRSLSVARISRQEESGIIAKEADTLLQGRTSRTGASSLAGFLFGGRRQEVQARTAYDISEKQVKVAEDYKKRLDAISLDRRIMAQEGDKDAAAWVKTFEGTEEYRGAVEGITAAEQKRGAALKDVQRFTEGALPAARNLLAITVGGAAFGVGLQAAGIAIAAVEKAATPYFDSLTGWAQKTADFTNTLADQARATQGNAKGVTALTLAQAGFADTTASSIAPVIAQRTQIEAGNKALVDQIQTLRNAQNLQFQNPNAGLTGGGTGGAGGTAIFGIASAGEQVGNYLQSLSHPPVPTPASILDQGGPVPALLSALRGPSSQSAATTRVNVAQQLGQGLDFLNAQINKGGGSLATFGVSVNNANKQLDGLDTERVAKLFDLIGSPEMAKGIRQNKLSAQGIQTPEDALQVLRQLNLSGTMIGPAEQLAQQRIAAQNAANSVPAIQAEQARQLPSFIGQQVRSAQYAQGTQLPMQAYLANLAAPPTTIGSSIAAGGQVPGIKGTIAAAGGAAEQAKINAGIKDAQGLQTTLDGFYAQGQKAVHDTYDPGVLKMFQQQGLDTFHNLLGSVQRVGAEMSKIQSGVNMEQAQYAAAQYTNEIRIASRSLTDIRQLTGQIGASAGDNLGIYERQNLLLGRQGQMLQFGLSQRQINLQVATAGFAAPGTTAEARAANIQEAKIEASYAQKQLDIQKKMFGNQVKVVDIGNLRQATDMIAQIGLLRQGRAVTLDIAIKQESLTRLNKLQAALMAQVNTYTSAVDSLSAKNIANIAEVESALGSFMGTVGTKAAKIAFATGQALYLGMTGGVLPYAGMGQGGSGGGGAHHASGFLGTTSGPSTMTVGEAGIETVAVLRNPRNVMSGGMGGGDMTVNIINPSVRNDDDLYAMKKMILDVLNQKAALQGLRGAVLQ